jgi:predicted metal-dependent peptidase
MHPKLALGIETLMCDALIDLEFYGQFNLFINFTEQNNIGTCAVNVTSKGMNFYYSTPFLDKLSQKEVNFILLHENFHLLFNHPQRTVTGIFNHKLANIAQDMIINHLIVQDITSTFAEIPKTEDGKNMPLFLPKEYTGKLIFEELYEWLKEEKEKWNKNKNYDPKNSYGPNGQNPKGRGESLDTWSLEHIFSNLDANEGLYLDVHITDEIPEDVKESNIGDVVRGILSKLQSRGFRTSNVEQTLSNLRKKRKDYLKEIKRNISNTIFGSHKEKTIVKPNRKSIPGIKGNKKVKNIINVILDTSGSMGGSFEKVLEYIYRDKVEINFIQGDTEVKWFEKIKSKKQIQTMKIKGLGGTILNPSIKYVKDNFNNYNTCILTDGATDSLDFSGIKGKVLIISKGTECPILNSNGKVKQIIIEK